MLIKVEYFGSYPLGAEIELDNVKIIQSEWNKYNNTVFIFGKKKYINPLFTQLFYVLSKNKVVFFTAYEYRLGHYHIFAVNEKYIERLREKVDYNMAFDDDKKLFDDLDKMIENHQLLRNNANSSSLYDSFFEIHKYICILEENGKIITNSKKSIKYLKDILLNDGPEYSLVIKFKSKAFMEKSYEIGVCVRGEPLIKKID